MREVVAEFERPVLLFSGGKDSIVMLRIAEKAFFPGQDSVSVDARRHRSQLSRGHGLPRSAGRRNRGPARRRLGRGGHSTGHGDRPDWTAGLA